MSYPSPGSVYLKKPLIKILPQEDFYRISLPVAASGG